MATYQVAWNPTTKIAKIQDDGDIPGAGFTDIGSFVHDHATLDPLGKSDNDSPLTDNHTYFHHVRDLLYLVGVENMQAVVIQDNWSND